MNNSLIAFNRNKIYTSLKEPDLSPSDSKLKALIELTDALGKFGYIIDTEALQYLSDSDISEYHMTVLPILSEVYKHTKYKNEETNINLDEWKKYHSIYNFYGSGDFRFIYQSAGILNLGITYLDRITSTDLEDILLRLIKKPENLTKEERNEFTYLIQKYKVLYPESNNKVCSLLLKIYDTDYNFESLNNFLDYSTIKLSRIERRLLMSKIENRLSKDAKDTINRKSWRELLKTLHPKDYSKLFPKTFEFYVDLINKKEVVPSESSYLEAKSYLDSERYDEFVNNFGRLLTKAYEQGDGSDADLVSLLCSGKLEINHLLSIMRYFQKNELGVDRYYCGVIRKHKNIPYLNLISTIKEFILKGIGMKQKNRKLLGKKIWIDTELKEYDFPYKIKRLPKKHLGTIDISKPVTKFTTVWNKEKIHYSTTEVYLWKGPGYNFKGGLGYAERNCSYLYSEGLEIPELKKEGYKYLVFDNRTSYQYNTISNAKVSLEIDKIKITSNNACRNRFGGLIDLETGDLWVLDFDLTKLPTFNGNIQEAIVRYFNDSFRFSIYDWYENYLISCGAIIVPKKSESEIQYTIETYKNDKSIIH